MLDPDSYYSTYLRNLINQHTYYLVPTQASYHVRNINSWLDVILIDSSDSVISFYKSPSPYIDGHDLVWADISLSTRKPNSISRTVRSFKNFSSSEYSDLASQRLKELNLQQTSHDVESYLTKFQTILLSCLDTLAPYITFQPKSRFAPWMTTELKVKRRLRDQLYKRARRTNEQSHWAEYRDIRRALKKELALARDENLKSTLNNINSQSEIWRVLRNMGFTTIFFHPPSIISRPTNSIYILV